MEEIGSFWYSDVEIDFVGRAGRKLVLGEAKWGKEKVDARELRRFIAKSELAAEKLGCEEVAGIVLSRSGFTSSARKMEGEGLVLISLDELGDVIKEVKKTRVAT